MGGDGGIDQIAAQPPQPRQGAILIRARKPAVADDVGHKDGSDLPGLGHAAPSRVMQNSTGKALGRASTFERERGRRKPAKMLA
jgi:hypothetical protein